MPDIEPVSIPLARLFAACWEAFQGGVGIDPLDLETMLDQSALAVCSAARTNQPGTDINRAGAALPMLRPAHVPPVGEATNECEYHTTTRRVR